MEPMKMPDSPAVEMDVKTGMANCIVLKSTYNGDTTSELTGWSTDAKPKLDWSAAK